MPEAAFEPAISMDPAVTVRRYREGLPLFDYDRDAPLAIKEGSVGRVDGINVHDLTYASPKGGRVSAFLVTPSGQGPFAGLIILHGLGGSRFDLLFLGEMYARLGAAVVLIDAPHARPENRKRPEGPVTFSPRDRDEQIQLIVDLRRAVDLLVETPGVDPDRIGYIGVSYGAAMGSLLAGVEHRIRAYALAVGDGGLVEHFTGPDDVNGDLQQLHRAQQERWLAAMEPIEPLYYVEHATPAALFFQSARHDELIPTEDAERLHAAGSEPKLVRWYDSGHDLPFQAFCDQVAWLAGYLRIETEGEPCLLSAGSVPLRPRSR